MLCMFVSELNHFLYCVVPVLRKLFPAQLERFIETATELNMVQRCNDSGSFGGITPLPVDTDESISDTDPDWHDLITEWSSDGSSVPSRPDKSASLQDQDFMKGAMEDTMERPIEFQKFISARGSAILDGMYPLHNELADQNHLDWGGPVSTEQELLFAFGCGSEFTLHGIAVRQGD